MSGLVKLETLTIGSGYGGGSSAEKKLWKLINDKRAEQEDSDQETIEQLRKRIEELEAELEALREDLKALKDKVDD